MKAFVTFGCASLAALCLGGLSFGDTLTLKNGDRVEGIYLGGTAQLIRMDVNGAVQTFDIGNVSGLRFNNSEGSSAPPPPPQAARAPRQDYPDAYPGNSSSSSSSNSDRPILRRAPNSAGDAPVAASAPPPPPPPPDYGSARQQAPAPVAQAQPIELPAGTRFTVRMVDSVDSQVARPGDTFRASVDEPVMIDGNVAIPRGADVVAKLVEEDQSGKITGRAVLKLVLSSVRVNDRSVDIVTSDVVKESGSRGARSAGVIGGGAVLGAIIGAAAGGGKGAAIGAGSGAAAGTGAEVMTKGQRVKIPSETRLEFTLSYAVRI